MITEFAQLNHENQIHQTLQVAALSITTNPYQGLKQLENHTSDLCKQNLSITTNPYQGLKVNDRFTVLTTTDLGDRY